MTFTFILQDDLADYRSTAAAARAQATTPPQRSPAALTGLSLTGIACGTNGVTLSAAWPTNTVISGEALDIFFSRSLRPQAWTNRWWAAVESAAGAVDITIPQSDLPPVPDAPAPACFTNIAPSAYDPGIIYTNIVCTNAVRPAVSGFFRLADLADSDGDGLTDAAETWTHGTNPGLADTDGDGLTDGAEIALGTSPLNPDTDGDGLPDGWEHQHGLDPLDADTDVDGVPDGTEAAWWETTAPLPWFDVSDGTPVCSNITVSSRLFPAALPFPVRIGGAVCTNALLDVNGIAYLINRLRPVDDLLHSRHYNSHLASDLPLTSSHFAVAAYWDSLYAIAFASTPASRITVADVTTNGTRYCVIEYRDMRFSYFQTSGFLSFQIVIPADGTNTVCVRYADAAGANTGASATLGAQGPGAAINMPVSYNQPFITDGLTLAYHFGTGGSPLLKDTDGDGLEDGTEVALGTSPANPDTDGDGLADAAEVALGTDPLIWDTDGDGLPDGWEVVNQFDPLDPADGDGDPDGDGLPNRDEFAHGTDPRNRDTDGDGLTDGAEVSIHHTSPLLQDTDSDGLADAAEINIHHTNPLQQDTDTDGMTDGWEVCHGFDPLVNNDTDSIEGNSATDDPDNDGLSNFAEYLNGTNPFNPDTDGDGVSDGAEVAQGSDPKNVSDNGQPPPPEDILELPFHIYGDYAAWEMTIEGQGPSDHRVLKLNTDAPDDSETVTNKLHRGNSYRLTMNWLGSGNYVDPYWHCWEAQVGGLPVRQAYGNPSDYATAVRNPGVVVNLLGA